MRFQVPQFIEVEDRIIGTLTLKQFIYLAAGAGLSFLIYTIVDSLVITAIPAIVIMGVAGGLAFYKVNNRPLIDAIEAAFKYWIGGKLFIWKKEPHEQPKTEAAAIHDAKNYASLTVPKISDSKLKDLSWSLDIKR